MSGRVHSVHATAANESDVALPYQLLHGQVLVKRALLDEGHQGIDAS